MYKPTISMWKSCANLTDFRIRQLSFPFYLFKDIRLGTGYGMATCYTPWYIEARRQFENKFYEERNKS